MMLLLGGAVLAVCVLILGVYLLQKSVHRALKPDEPRRTKVRVQDEAAFTLATVKAVITQLKTDQQVTQEKLVAAERRADENARKFDLIAREVDFGLMIFDAEGFIAFSNPLARKLLAVDTWSRRRYGETFHDIPVLSKLIGESFETGAETRKKTIEFRGYDECKGWVELSVLTTRDRSGAIDIVACVLREVGPPAPQAPVGANRE